MTRKRVVIARCQTTRLRVVLVLRKQAHPVKSMQPAPKLVAKTVNQAPILGMRNRVKLG